MRVGLMGGSFDPIHNAHIHIAEVAKDALSLDEVLFIPAGVPPHKALRATTEERLEMARLATRELAWAKVYEEEAMRAGTTYTVDTLERLTRERPGDTFFYIVGTDALRDMPLWREAARAMTFCEIAAVTRPGSPEGEMEAAVRVAEETLGARVHVIRDENGIDASSTLLRETVAAGEGTVGLVPVAVAEYIARRGLYRSTSER